MTLFRMPLVIWSLFIVAILLLLYANKTPAEVLASDPSGVLRQLDLEEHLSPTRRNGLHAMLKRIRALAEAHTHD